MEWCGLHGLQVECLESTWKPDVEFEKYLAGLPAKKIHMHGIMESSGFHLESMEEGKVLMTCHAQLR
jgi:hypothetical protein